MRIRLADGRDDGAIWRVIEPTIQAGETLMLPVAMSEAEALAYWRSPSHEVFVAHVAKCGYATAPAAAGRGIARAMCVQSLDRARARGFRAMQFNCVVASNGRAVGLWQSCGFAVVGRVPETFRHPELGLVDTLVMHRPL